MGGYEYIIASLPAISKDWRFADGKSLEGYVSWIKTQMPSRDAKAVDTLLDSLKEECMTPEFYETALKDKNRFIREYLAFDLGLRNTQARFVNKVFGRPESDDTINLEGVPAFEEADKVNQVLSGHDILVREKGLDSIRWDKISDLTTFNYFDLDAVLGIIAKMSIVERWRALDPESGAEMFQRLIAETRGTYGGVNYTEPAKE